MLAASHHLESTWNIRFVPHLDYLVLMAVGHILLPSSNVDSAQNLTRPPVLDTWLPSTRHFLWYKAIIFFLVIQASLSSFEREPFGPKTVVPEMVKTPHGSLSSPSKPLSPFCSQCLIGSRLESTYQPRARHGFQETSFQLFICSLSSLSIYLFRCCSVVFIVSCLGGTCEFLRVRTRGNLYSQCYPRRAPNPRTTQWAW
jgi:hypothetical protein